MKRKLIITIDNDDIDDQEALRRVSEVVKGGKISEHGGKPQYCFLTVFEDEVRLLARDKKNPNTDSFVIW